MFTVDGLCREGLIEARDGQGTVVPAGQADAHSTLHVTEQWSRIQRALGVSLTQIASIVPRSSQVVTPSFGPSKGKKTCDVFVVMPFADRLRPIYDDHIKPVVLKAGLTCRRGDDFFANGAIIQDIWDAVSNAMSVVADCTERNPNVFYEIGMAHTVGVPTILMTQDKGDVPFDIGHVRRIEYEYTPPGMREFETALENALREITTPGTL
ncbi:MAG: hypothetical protein L0Y70_08210 [Gemmataceae bacterium]|nr:hypothetical protein [Gemmataceae bacterium]